MVIEERRPGLFIVKLEDGRELALTESRGGLNVRAVDGRLAILPHVANDITLQVVEP